MVLVLYITVSCKKDKVAKIDSAKEVSQIPYGGTGELESGNYAGQGAVTNVAGTTLNTEGNVTVDALSISGDVVVPLGSVLTIIGDLHLGGGGNIDVQGTLICANYTQVGNSYIKNGKLVVTGKFTVGGGTTLYLETSEVEASEFVIIGHIQAIQNDLTKAGRYYSIIESTGSKYLNRGGGTTVCGPLLFTVNTDQGASGVAMENVTSSAVNNNANIKTNYGLSADAQLYQYQGTCTPLTAIPVH